MPVYLIPCPIEEGKIMYLPPATIQILHSLDHFVVERAKTARHFIKDANHPLPISSLHIVEIDNQSDHWKKEVNQWMIHKISIGIISEAGCPGVADPGAEIVAMAHQNQTKVIPLVGPSSILLALMASGMNGQKFTFHGYLPNKKNELVQYLKKIEKEALSGHTQIFMETPYRNGFMLETMFFCLSDHTKLCLACDINGETEEIITQSIKFWKKIDPTIYHKRPCIFVLGS